ncbi:MAG: hypothetical protein JNM64_21130, partial [Chloroflexia bacterium]|nr:hypothetical protein [Chloroflexia bacterium]
MTPRAWAIGVDVGGTKIAAAAVDSLTAEVIFRRQIATEAVRPAAEIVTDIVQEIDAVAAELGFAGDTAVA